MNKYAESMKKIMSDYRASVINARAEMEENNKTYSPAVAAERNAKLSEAISGGKYRAIDGIKAAAEAARNDINTWGALDGEKIHADAKLLEYGMTPQQFNGLVSKHRNNATMLTLLKGYADRVNRETAQTEGGNLNTSRYFDTSRIPTAEAKIGEIDKLAAGASSLIDSISRRDDAKTGAGANGTIASIGLELFGQTSDILDE